MIVDKQRAMEELLIKEEIRENMMRYARGVNRLDGDLVRSCFHPDAIEKHGDYFGDTHVWAQALPQLLRDSFQFTFHLLGNSLIEIESNRASHETYFIGYHRLHPDEDGTEKDVIFGGRYLGVNESRNGGPWLIAERTVVHDWSRIDRVTEAWPVVQQFEQGDHSGSGNDIAYHLLSRGPFGNAPGASG
jgi:hypothetical protein